MQNGELPESLNPSVFWLLIGTNNLEMDCSAEVVVMGIIRNVEEILSRKPSSTVVLNQIFPRSKPYNMEGYVYVLPENAEYQPILQIYIDQINTALEAYAREREGVQYFSTDAFWADDSTSAENMQLDLGLIPDAVHLYATGYEVWAQEIVAKLDSILG